MKSVNSRSRSGRRGGRAERNMDFSRAQLRTAPLVLSLSQELGAGEAEAIVLAQELAGRFAYSWTSVTRCEKARRLRIPVMVSWRFAGSKGRGLLGAVKPIIHDLKRYAGFHSSPQLVAEV